MAKDQTGAAGLEVLQSSEQQNLLDEIDNLRLQGISEFVFLPQIIVCGDQSSGKSSVLEAISNVPFPRSDTQCTRFATEVILRQAANQSATVSIIPHGDLPVHDRERQSAFKQTLEGLTGFANAVEEAKKEMGIGSVGKSFSRSILRVEITGPKMPKLTLVDLPGLIHTSGKHPASEDVELISGLVQSYMQNPRSVILAVVSASNDYANQIILRKARDIDPQGERTLGLITRPDMLDKNSGREAEYMKLARNDDISFRLGWHVIRNRNYTERDSSSEERDRVEELFFSRGIWKDLGTEMTGIKSLRFRLSSILLNQIRTHLPTLMNDMRISLKDCNTKLDTLGENRATPEKQRDYLFKLSRSFEDLCKSATNGNYNYKFFDDALDDEQCNKRLRAIVQNLNVKFSATMRAKGHKRIINDAADDNVHHPFRRIISSDMNIAGQEMLSREDALRWVKDILTRSRGRELPGSYDPLLVGQLFRSQAVKWKEIAHDHIDSIWNVCRAHLRSLLQTTADEKAIGGLLVYCIEPESTRRWGEAEAALDVILGDLETHPITYNHYYTETLQQIREAKKLESIEQALINMPPDRWGEGESYKANLENFTKRLAMTTIVNMDDFACSDLLDSMQAYYTVALKTFVDNVCVQVVERILVKDLDRIVSPYTVAKMPQETVSAIAAESSQSQISRRQLERKLEILRRGMSICQKHVLFNVNEPYVSSNEPEIDENESANCDSVKAESESNMELDVSRSYSDNGHPDSD